MNNSFGFQVFKRNNNTALNSVKNLFLLLLFFLFAGCAVLRKKEIVEIKFAYPAELNVNYGCGIPIKTYAVYSDGTMKGITKNDGLTISALGGVYENGFLRIEAYPEKSYSDQIKVSANFTSKKAVFKQSESISFNYKGDLSINFTGKNGAKPTIVEENEGLRVVVFQEGKDRLSGNDGENRNDGPNISIFLSKSKDNFYLLKVVEAPSNNTYYYNYKDLGHNIKINVSGGNGGAGGNGGIGEDGEDGREKDNGKLKRAGNGGNGGNAGNGGYSGDGGLIQLIIHPNAAHLKPRIELYNLGGLGGESGAPGNGGRTGKNLENQSSGDNGLNDLHGNKGLDGRTGASSEIIIQEFPLEN